MSDYKWDMVHHKDLIWYACCLVGWLTDKSRTKFANVTHEEPPA